MLGLDPVVRREIVVAAPREQVWAALTEAERLAEWFASEVELELRPGGVGAFRWGDGSERRARVERVEEGRALELTWSEPGGPPTRVELTLADVPEGTRVRVTETAPQACASLAGEWSWGVALLAALPRLHRLAVA